MCDSRNLYNDILYIAVAAVEIKGGYKYRWRGKEPGSRQIDSEAEQIGEADNTGKQENIPGQWNVNDMDLVLQYDDRYSLDNIKKD